RKTAAPRTWHTFNHTRFLGSRGMDLLRFNRMPVRQTSRATPIGSQGDSHSIHYFIIALSAAARFGDNVFARVRDAITPSSAM
ncbi:MAG: hypothetical protein ACREIA_23000, partial [Opitutaceae bacterium]